MKKAMLAAADSVESIMAEAVLQHLGFKIIRAKNGTEAAIRANIESLALILMEAGMCGRDGKPTIAALRANSKTKAIPTLAIAEKNSAPLSEQEYRALGYDGWVIKPVSVAQVRKLIEPRQTSES